MPSRPNWYNHAGKIIQTILNAGFTIANLQMMKISREAFEAESIQKMAISEAREVARNRFRNGSESLWNWLGKRHGIGLESVWESAKKVNLPNRRLWWGNGQKFDCFWVRFSSFFGAVHKPIPELIPNRFQAVSELIPSRFHSLGNCYSGVWFCFEVEYCELTRIRMQRGEPNLFSASLASWGVNGLNP